MCRAHTVTGIVPLIRVFISFSLLGRKFLPRVNLSKIRDLLEIQRLMGVRRKKVQKYINNKVYFQTKLLFNLFKLRLISTGA